MSEELKLKLSFDTSEAEAAAEALPDAIDRANRKGKKKPWERQDDPRGSAADYKKMAGMADEAERQEQARRAREQKEEEDAYKKRLKWNSKILEEQQKAANQAANAKEWTEEFGRALENVLLRSIGPAAIAAKAIEVGWGNVIGMVKNIYMAGETKLSAGIDPKQLLLFQRVANVGTANNDQVTAMYTKAQANVNALATGAPGGNAYGFQYFGMTDYQRYRKEGLPVAELIMQMGKKYGKEGGTAAYGEAAKSIFGEDWHTIKALLALEARSKRSGDVMTYIEAGGSVAGQYARALYMNQQARALTPGELMGGTNGRPNQILSNVTSLQAMGGGDVLSAIARGPQDRIADNTERTATAVEKMANPPQNTQSIPTVLK